jgi:phosphoglycolate phosphatase
MISTLIFDFDGTIADTFDLAMAIGKKITGSLGMPPLSNEQIIHFRNAPIREAVRDLKVPLRKMPGLLMQVRQEIHKHRNEIRPIQGIVEVLREFRSCCESLGIVTSNSEENVSCFLKNYDLDFFDFGMYSSAIFGKASKLRSCINKHHLDKERILYVGDTIGDITSCRKAGIKVAAVTWGYNAKEVLETSQPDILVSHPHELLDMVKLVLSKRTDSLR